MRLRTRRFDLLECFMLGLVAFGFALLAVALWPFVLIGYAIGALRHER